MIIENQYLEDIQKIWKRNNLGYINVESNQKGIEDKDMIKIVWRENNTTMAYLILYLGKDFCEKEGFPNKIENMPDQIGYIWEVVTDINYIGKGIANKLLNYVIEKYQNYTLFSCIDTKNIPSLKLHEKNGFKTLYEFEKIEEDKISRHIIMIRENKEKYVEKTIN